MLFHGTVKCESEEYFNQFNFIRKVVMETCASVGGEFPSVMFHRISIETHLNNCDFGMLL